MTTFTADDGARIAYTDTGTGRPLLCLAGLTRNHSDFDYIAPHLPEGTRVIAMDYRGRGGSDWTGADTYTIAREGADALNLLDHLGISSAPILGTSRGGLIAMYLMAIAPERVAGLCLNDIGPVIDRAGLDRIADYVGRSPRAITTYEDMAKALAAQADGFANVPDSRWMEEARKHYIQTDAGLQINYDPELRQSFLAAYEAEDQDAWPLWDLCATKPAALIRGANSDLLSRATAAEMARRHGNLIYAEIPDRAHIPFLDEPGSIAAITEFLETVHGA